MKTLMTGTLIALGVFAAAATDAAAQIYTPPSPWNSPLAVEQVTGETTLSATGTRFSLRTPAGSYVTLSIYTAPPPPPPGSQSVMIPSVAAPRAKAMIEMLRAFRGRRSSFSTFSFTGLYRISPTSTTYYAQNSSTARLNVAAPLDLADSGGGIFGGVSSVFVGTEGGDFFYGHLTLLRDGVRLTNFYFLNVPAVIDGVNCLPLTDARVQDFVRTALENPMRIRIHSAERQSDGSRVLHSSSWWGKS